MSLSPTTLWWQQHAHKHGHRIMDCTLPAEWDHVAFLENGKTEFKLFREGTGLTVEPDRRVLEIGCGMGRLAFALADAFGEVVGIDVNRSLILHAREMNDRSHLRFAVCEGDGLSSLGTETFETVVSNEVFHYLDRATLTNYFAEAFERLTPGGEFAFEWNCHRFGRRSRLNSLIRFGLAAMGVKQWRGWPTHPGSKRYVHSPEFVAAELDRVGFTEIEIDASNPQGAWAIARKTDREPKPVRISRHASAGSEATPRRGSGKTAESSQFPVG